MRVCRYVDYYISSALRAAIAFFCSSISASASVLLTEVAAVAVAAIEEEEDDDDDDDEEEGALDGTDVDFEEFTDIAEKELNILSAS